MEIVEEPSTRETLVEYGRVPISFMVESQYIVESIQGSDGEWSLSEQPVAQPYLKDYDALAHNAPGQWIDRFDISNWCVLSAFEGQNRVGGVVIASDTPGLDMDEEPNVAILWDIRVQPEYRRSSVGSLLFPYVVAWARDHECTTLKVETQNINVPACKFYARLGFSLQAVHPRAYPESPDETQLIWHQNI